MGDDCLVDLAELFGQCDTTQHDPMILITDQSRDSVDILLVKIGDFMNDADCTKSCLI